MKKPSRGFSSIIFLLLAVLVIGAGVYLYLNVRQGQTVPVSSVATTTTTSGKNSTGAYKTITNPALSVSFDVPQDWTTEDHLNDAGSLWFLDPKSLGDGGDGYSFDFEVSTSSARFSGLLLPNTADHFAQVQALPNGTVMKAPGKDVGNASPLAGEEFTKIDTLNVAGYPVIHFRIVDATSYDWGTREMQDGYWVRAGNRNLFFYFGNIDSAQKYNYGTEASVMQHTFASIHINSGM